MTKQFKSFVAAALLLSMTATAATPVCNAAALNAADTAITTDALNLTYQEDGKTVRTISGEISAAKISSEADAKTVLNGIADLLGVTDFDAQLRFICKEESEINYSYVYQQYVGNVPLDNGFVTLIVNKDTKKVVYLTSNFAPDLEINTTPAVSRFGARMIVKQVLGTEPDGVADLMIAESENGHKLAWLITNGETDSFYVDAQTGEILKSMNGHNYKLTIYNTKYNDVACRDRFSMPLEVENAADGEHKYYLYFRDVNRKLYIVNNFSSVDSSMSRFWGTPNDVTQTYSNEAFLRANPWYYDNQEYGGKWAISNYGKGDFSNSTTYNDNPVATGALFRVGQVYDFYKKYFNWNGIDNAGTNIYIAPFEKGKISATVNAYSSQFGNLLGFGTNSNGRSLMADLDVVAHEYQHSVSDRKVKWGFSGFDGYTGETLILNEGYADVLGEYCDILQDGEDPNEWMGGYDVLNEGSATDRSYIKHFKNELDSSLNYVADTSVFYNKIEAHDGAAVLSHAAYLMHSYGVPDNYAARIWFYSMDYLPKGADVATLYDWRNALAQAANDILDKAYSNTRTRNLMKAKVLMACNAVHVPAPTSRLGDANGNCRLDSGDVTYLSQYLNGTRTLDAFNLSLCDVNKDGNVTSSDLTRLRKAVNSNEFLTF